MSGDIGYNAALKWRRDAIADGWEDRKALEKNGVMYFTLHRDSCYLFIAAYGRGDSGKVVYCEKGKRRRSLTGSYPEGIDGQPTT